MDRDERRDVDHDFLGGGRDGQWHRQFHCRQQYRRGENGDAEHRRSYIHRHPGRKQQPYSTPAGLLQLFHLSAQRQRTGAGGHRKCGRVYDERVRVDGVE